MNYIGYISNTMSSRTEAAYYPQTHKTCSNEKCVLKDCTMDSPQKVVYSQKFSKENMS